jgi:hypothetical protein
MLSAIDFFVFADDVAHLSVIYRISQVVTCSLFRLNCHCVLDFPPFRKPRRNLLSFIQCRS